jgi:hypothetical protein
VAAAIVELDPLPDAVGAASEDHHFLAVGDLGLVLRFPEQGSLICGI